MCRTFYKNNSAQELPIDGTEHENNTMSRDLNCADTHITMNLGCTGMPVTGADLRDLAYHNWTAPVHH